MIAVLYIIAFALFGAAAGLAFRYVGPGDGRSWLLRTTVFAVAFALGLFFARYVIGVLGSHPQITTPVGIISSAVFVALFVRISRMFRS